MLRRILKRTFCTLLALALVTTMFSVIGATDVFPTAQAAATVTDPDADLFFIAPEAIYLTPKANAYTTDTSSTFQWYVNNTLDGTTVTPMTGESETGIIAFRYPNASNVRVTFRWQATPGTDLTSAASIVFGDGTERTPQSTGYLIQTDEGVGSTAIVYGNSPELTAATSGVWICWIATYTDASDGVQKQAYAYTYVYKPYVAPIAVGVRGLNTRGRNFYGSYISWISGVHGVAAVRSGASWPNTSGKGLIPFSSSASGLECGNLNLMLPGFFTFPIGSEGPGNWFSSSRTAVPDATGFVKSSTSSSHNSGDDYVLTYAYSSTGKLTVDSSRYENLNEVPNLSVGLMITDDEQSDHGAAYFISNFTGHTSRFDSDYTNYYRTSSDTCVREYWDVLLGSDPIAAAGSRANMSASESEGVKFNERWRKDIRTATSGTFYVGTGYANCQNADYIYDLAELRCDVEVFDKAALRDAYLYAMKTFPANNASVLGENSASWRDFMELYHAVAFWLCKIDCGAYTTTCGCDTATELANMLKQKAGYNLPSYNMDPTYTNDVYFVAPEAIYLAPQANAYTSSTKSTFQYYVDQTLDGSTITNRTGEQKTGNFYFYYPKATGNVTISFHWQNTPGVNTSDTENITLSRNGTATEIAPGADFTTTSSASPILIKGGVSPTLAASTEGTYIEWTATYTDSVDGQTKTAYAYTYVYKPYVYPIGVAQRTENTRGVNFYGQNISWISGVHGTAEPAERYPSVNASYNFLPFSSGSTLTPQLSNNFTSEGFDNVSSGNWVSGSSAVAPDMSCHFFASTTSAHSSGDDEVLNFAYSATGLLTVDNSRYTNFNQIPNLTVGLMVTDDEHSDSGQAAYFVSNVTGSKHDADYTDYWATSDETADTYWNDYYTGSKIDYAGNFPSEMTADETEGVKINARWNRSVSSASGVYYVGAGYANRHDDNFIVNVAELRCQVNLYNKSALRTAYQTAMRSFAKNNSALLKSEYFTKFINLYRAVAKELCKVSGMFQTVEVNGETYSTAAALANAMNAMTKTCSMFNPTVRSTFTATQKHVKVYDDSGWKLDRKESDSAISGYYKGAKLTFLPKQFDGYTYAGYVVSAESQTTTGAATTGQPDNVQSGNCVVQRAASNVTVSFYYLRENYTISFDANGGNSVAQMTYNIESTAALPSTTRIGYTFTGWKATKSVGSWKTGVTYNAGTSLTGKTGNVTLQAQWVMSDYTITFDVKGGSAISAITYNSASTVTLPNATRTGFVFGGWRVNTGVGNWTAGTVYPAGASVSGKYGNVTLTAQWTSTAYAISYELNGGAFAQSNPTSYTIETDTFTLNNPTRTGYDFEGWTGSNGTEPQLTVVIPQGSTGSKSFTANWRLITYSITYVLNGGTLEQPNPSYYTIETETFTLKNPTRTGYTFDGWVSSGIASLQMTVIIPRGSTGDRMYLANWRQTEYTIAYSLNGGTTDIPNPTTYTVESVFRLNDPARTGYTFTGWTGTDLTGETIGPIISHMTGNRYYTAHWKANTYFVQFRSNGGTGTMPTMEYIYDSAAVLLPQNQFVRSGYVFLGWAYTADADAPDIEIDEPVRNLSAQPDATVILYAVWEEDVCEHIYSAVVTAPTCTEDGYTTYTCELCGETYVDDVVPALGHDYEAIVTEPTCTQQGYTTYVCKNDPTHTYKDQYTPALDHAWGEWEVTTEPTTTQEGEKTRVCSRCGKTESETIPPLPIPENGTLALSKTSAHPGDTVTVTVSIRDNPGIISAMLHVQYDPQILTLIDVENSGLLGTESFHAGNDYSKVPYTFFWVNGLLHENISDDGVIATLTFRVAEDAPTGATPVTITYSLDSTLNTDLDEVSFLLENGEIDVTPRLPGDADGDGVMNLKDVILIERFLAGGWNVTIDMSNVDVDGNGEVNLIDVVLIARWLAGGWGVVLR